MTNAVHNVLALFSILCILILTINPSHAIKVYKSIGTHGEVKYNQYTPQDGKKVEVIEFRSDGRHNKAAQLADKAQVNQNEMTQNPEEQRVVQLEARIKEQEVQANTQRCQSLRNNLTNLDAGGRIYEMDANNKRKYLDSREIELRLERVQQAISQYCTQ